MLPKILILISIAISAKCLYVRRYQHPTLFLNNVEHSNVIEGDLEDSLSELPKESVYPGYLKRVARQTNGNYRSSSISDGGGVNFCEMNKWLYGGGDSKLSSIGLVQGTANNGIRGGLVTNDNLKDVYEYLDRYKTNSLADITAMPNLNSITEPPPVKIVPINPLFNWNVLRPRITK